MGEIVGFPKKIKRVVVVDEAKRTEAINKIRVLVQGIRTLEVAALRQMMELGDVLRPIRIAAEYGSWTVSSPTADFPSGTRRSRCNWRKRARPSKRKIRSALRFLNRS